MSAPLPDDAPTDPVLETVQRWAAEPFVWGTSDCALSVLGHTERVLGKRLDPPPRYSGELGARRYALRRGGFQAVFAASVEAVGCVPTAEPVRGDIGMIDVPEVGLTAVLCVSARSHGRPPRWAARGDGMVALIEAEPVIAWSVPCRW